MWFAGGDEHVGSGSGDGMMSVVEVCGGCLIVAVRWLNAER